MVKPVIHNNMKQNSDRLSTVVFWLNTVFNDINKASWQFIHFITREPCDIRNFKENNLLQKHSDFFLKDQEGSKNI